MPIFVMRLPPPISKTIVYETFTESLTKTKPPSINIDISTVLAVVGVSKKYYSTRRVTVF